MARIFVVDGREQPDPDPAMSVDQVRELLSTYFPELANADVKEVKRDDDTVVEFNKRVGVKG
jgi:PRTRC genetic system protein C